MPPGNWLRLGSFQPKIAFQIGFRRSRSALTVQNTESIFSKRTEPNYGKPLMSRHEAKPDIPKPAVSKKVKMNGRTREVVANKAATHVHSWPKRL
jgi:hypothetical protein